jgi:hypothetical protein
VFVGTVETVGRLAVCFSAMRPVDGVRVRAAIAACGEAVFTVLVFVRVAAFFAAGRDDAAFLRAGATVVFFVTLVAATGLRVAVFFVADRASAVFLRVGVAEVCLLTVLLAALAGDVLATARNGMGFLRAAAGACLLAFVAAFSGVAAFFLTFGGVVTFFAAE